jgi:cytochrome P450
MMSRVWCDTELGSWIQSLSASPSSSTTFLWRGRTSFAETTWRGSCCHRWSAPPRCSWRRVRIGDGSGALPRPHFDTTSCLLSFPHSARSRFGRSNAGERHHAERPVDVAAAMAQTTFEVVVDTVLGGAGAVDAQGFARALTTELDSFPWRFILSSFRAPSWLPYPGRRRAARAREHMLREAARLVTQRRQVPSARADLLDLLLQARDEQTGRVMSDDELVRNLTAFILAGHETTAVALTWTLWLLAKYPDVQDQVAAEAQATIGSGAVESQHVDRLTFTRQVLQEAMRLYPPVPAISRQPLAPLALGGERLSPATQVMITIYPLHRNRRVWQNPHSFDPDRFAVEQTKARPRCAYLPFGAGPRICIGASFAMIEATVVLAHLIHAFRFKAVAGHRPHPVARVTLRPRGGMPLYIEPR